MKLLIHKHLLSNEIFPSSLLSFLFCSFSTYILTVKSEHFLGKNVCHREIANYSKVWNLFRKSTLYKFSKLFLKIFLGKISWLSVIKCNLGTCLVVQWLRLCSSAGDVGSIPGQGAKISHASGTKNRNINYIITNSIKTSKMVHIKKKKILWLPWWLSGKESACQCRRHESDPWSRKIPHAEGQLSPCATATEPVLKPRGCNYWSPHSWEPVPSNKRSPPQWEAHAQQLKDPTLHNYRKACIATKPSTEISK